MFGATNDGTQVFVDGGGEASRPVVDTVNR